MGFRLLTALFVSQVIYIFFSKKLVLQRHFYIGTKFMPGSKNYARVDLLKGGHNLIYSSTFHILLQELMRHLTYLRVNELQK